MTLALAALFTTGLGATAARADASGTGTVTGTVTGSGAPVAGVVVSVTTGPMSAVSVNTDANGSFSLSGVPAGSASVSVFDGSWLWVSTRVTAQVLDGGTTPLGTIDLLPRDKSLSGVVRNSVTNQPISGVRVDVAEPSNQFLRSGVSGADGRYTIDHLAGNTVSVSVTATADYQGTSFSDVRISDAAFDLRLSPVATGIGVVSGVVTDKVTGAPVASARVSFSPDVRGSGFRSADSDAQGRYVITGLPGGTGLMSVYAPSYANAASVRVTVGAAAVEQNFRLAPIETGSASISAMFVDDSGAPIPNMYVSVTRIGSGPVPGGSPTDSSGAATISGLAAGTYSIDLSNIPRDSAQHDLYQRLGSVSVKVPTSTSAVAGLRYVLKRYPTGNGSVHGVITDARTGSPVSGVTVSLRSQTTGASYTTTSGSSGSWTMTNLADGIYDVSFQPAYSGPTYENAFTNSPLTISGSASVERTDTLRSIVAGGSTLSGKIRDFSTHQPIAGATVVLYRDNGGLQAPTTTTDASGSYSFDNLPAGRYTAQITAVDHDDSNSSVGVALNGTDPQTANYVLRPSAHVDAGTGAITGTVIDPYGDPIPGASVYIAPVAGTGASLGGSGVQTDASGRFERTGLPLTTVSVSIIAPDQSLASYDNVVTLSTSNPTMDLPVTMVKGGAISGSVSAPDFGSIPAGLTVREVDPVTLGSTGAGGGVDTTTGAFTITNLKPGPHYIQIVADGSAGTPSVQSAYWVQSSLIGAQAVSGATPITIAAGDVSSDHNFVIQRGGAITGKVQMATTDGPVALADGKLISVQVWTLTGQTWSRVTTADTWASSASSGDFTVTNLPGGDFRLQFVDQYAGDRALAPVTSATIHVNPPETSPLAAVAMEPMVPSADPAPINFSEVSSTYLDSLAGTIATDSTGTAGQDVTIDVGQQYAGEYVAVWANSTPQRMSSWVRVAPNGKISATLPNDLPAGSHRIIVQDANQQPVGWAPITVAAAPGGSGPSSNLGAAASGSDATGGSGSAGSGSTSTGSAATGSGTATSTGGTSSTSRGSGASFSSSTDATPAATPSPATTAAPWAVPSSTTPPAPSAVAPTATTPAGGTGPSPLVVVLIVIGALVVLAVAGVIVFRRRAA